MLLDFTYISPIVKNLCDELHQKILLPFKSDKLEFKIDGNFIETFEKYKRL